MLRSMGPLAHEGPPHRHLPPIEEEPPGIPIVSACVQSNLPAAEAEETKHTMISLGQSNSFPPLHVASTSKHKNALMGCFTRFFSEMIAGDGGAASAGTGAEAGAWTADSARASAGVATVTASVFSFVPAVEPEDGEAPRNRFK